MKIVDVETIMLANPDVLDRSDSSQDTAVIRVTTDEGITGIGARRTLLRGLSRLS